MESLFDLYMQKTHFGTYPIENRIDSGQWKINYPNFYNLELDKQK